MLLYVDPDEAARADTRRALADAIDTEAFGETVAEYLHRDGPDAHDDLVALVEHSVAFLSQTAYPLLDDENAHLAALDEYADDDPNVPARLVTVSSPSDLTSIGMRFSDVHRSFSKRDIGRVRTGLYSVSTLLTFSDLQTVSRFVHTLVGRIDSVDGFGLLLVDPTNHEEQAVSTLAQFCDGRVDVRDDGDGPELRTTGLPGHSRDWRSFSPDE
jgi:hypothetical protein